LICQINFKAHLDLPGTGLLEPTDGFAESAPAEQKLFVAWFDFFAHQSGVNISRSTAVRNITAHIAEGAGLLAGRTSIGHGISPKRVTTI
jgi:hypothetical protein